MKKDQPYNLDDEVYYPCDAAPFKVVGIRKTEIEIEGDWSGGTNHCCSSSWVPIDSIKPFDWTKVKIYNQ